MKKNSMQNIVSFLTKTKNGKLSVLDKMIYKNSLQENLTNTAATSNNIEKDADHSVYLMNWDDFINKLREYKYEYYGTRQSWWGDSCSWNNTLIDDHLLNGRHMYVSFSVRNYYRHENDADKVKILLTIGCRWMNDNYWTLSNQGETIEAIDTNGDFLHTKEDCFEPSYATLELCKKFIDAIMSMNIEKMTNHDQEFFDKFFVPVEYRNRYSSAEFRQFEKEYKTENLKKDVEKVINSVLNKDVNENLTHTAAAPQNDLEKEADDMATNIQTLLGELIENKGFDSFVHECRLLPLREDTEFIDTFIKGSHYGLRFISLNETFEGSPFITGPGYSDTDIICWFDLLEDNEDYETVEEDEYFEAFKNLDNETKDRITKVFMTSENLTQTAATQQSDTESSAYNLINPYILNFDNFKRIWDEQFEAFDNDEENIKYNCVGTLHLHYNEQISDDQYDWNDCANAWKQLERYYGKEPDKNMPYVDFEMFWDDGRTSDSESDYGILIDNGYVWGYTDKQPFAPLSECFDFVSENLSNAAATAQTDHISSADNFVNPFVLTYDNFKNIWDKEFEEFHKVIANHYTPEMRLDGYYGDYEQTFSEDESKKAWDAIQKDLARFKNNEIPFLSLYIYWTGIEEDDEQINCGISIERDKVWGEHTPKPNTLTESAISNRDYCRLATSDDMAAITRILEARIKWMQSKNLVTFQPQGLRKVYRKDVENNRMFVFVHNGEPIGFCAADYKDDWVWGRDGVSVPGHSDLNIYPQLLDYIIQYYKKPMRGSVIPINPKLLSMYHSFGFKTIERKEDNNGGCEVIQKDYVPRETNENLTQTAATNLNTNSEADDLILNKSEYDVWKLFHDYPNIIGEDYSRGMVGDDDCTEDEVWFIEYNNRNEYNNHHFDELEKIFGFPLDEDGDGGFDILARPLGRKYGLDFYINNDTNGFDQKFKEDKEKYQKILNIAYKMLWDKINNNENLTQTAATNTDVEAEANKEIFVHDYASFKRFFISFLEKQGVQYVAEENIFPGGAFERRESEAMNFLETYDGNPMYTVESEDDDEETILVFVYCKQEPRLFVTFTIIPIADKIDINFRIGYGTIDSINFQYTKDCSFVNRADYYSLDRKLDEIPFNQDYYEDIIHRFQYYLNTWESFLNLVVIPNSKKFAWDAYTRRNRERQKRVQKNHEILDKIVQPSVLNWLNDMLITSPKRRISAINENLTQTAATTQTDLNTQADEQILSPSDLIDAYLKKQLDNLSKSRNERIDFSKFFFGHDAVWFNDKPFNKVVYIDKDCSDESYEELTKGGINKIRINGEWIYGAIPFGHTFLFNICNNGTKEIIDIDYLDEEEQKKIYDGLRKCNDQYLKENLTQAAATQTENIEAQSDNMVSALPLIKSALSNPKYKEFPYHSSFLSHDIIYKGRKFNAVGYLASDPRGNYYFEHYLDAPFNFEIGHVYLLGRRTIKSRGIDIETLPPNKQFEVLQAVLEFKNKLRSVKENLTHTAATPSFDFDHKAEQTLNYTDEIRKYVEKHSFENLGGSKERKFFYTRTDRSMVFIPQQHDQFLYIEPELFKCRDWNGYAQKYNDDATETISAHFMILKNLLLSKEGNLEAVFLPITNFSYFGDMEGRKHLDQKFEGEHRFIYTFQVEDLPLAIQARIFQYLEKDDKENFMNENLTNTAATANDIESKADQYLSMDEKIREIVIAKNIRGMNYYQYFLPCKIKVKTTDHRTDTSAPRVYDMIILIHEEGEDYERKYGLNILKNFTDVEPTENKMYLMNYSRPNYFVSFDHLTLKQKLEILRILTTTSPLPKSKILKENLTNAAATASSNSNQSADDLAIDYKDVLKEYVKSHGEQDESTDECIIRLDIESERPKGFSSLDYENNFIADNKVLQLPILKRFVLDEEIWDGEIMVNEVIYMDTPKFPNMLALSVYAIEYSEENGCYMMEGHKFIKETQFAFPNEFLKELYTFIKENK